MVRTLGTFALCGFALMGCDSTKTDKLDDEGLGETDPGVVTEETDTAFGHTGEIPDDTDGQNRGGQNRGGQNRGGETGGFQLPTGLGLPTGLLGGTGGLQLPTGLFGGTGGFQLPTGIFNGTGGFQLPTGLFPGDTDTDLLDSDTDVGDTDLADTDVSDSDTDPAPQPASAPPPTFGSHPQALFAFP